MFVKLGLLALLIYCLMPGDNSGLPYPQTPEGMREHIVELEKFLKDTEERYARVTAYRDVMFQSSLFDPESIRAQNEYFKLYERRRNAECRIKNMKKLLRKYEEIDSHYHSSPPTSDSVTTGAT